jgi:hypothetical protein
MEFEGLLYHIHKKLQMYPIPNNLNPNPSLKPSSFKVNVLKDENSLCWECNVLGSALKA